LICWWNDGIQLHVLLLHHSKYSNRGHLVMKPKICNSSIRSIQFPTTMVSLLFKSVKSLQTAIHLAVRCTPLEQIIIDNSGHNIPYYRLQLFRLLLRRYILPNQWRRQYLGIQITDGRLTTSRRTYYHQFVSH